MFQKWSLVSVLELSYILRILKKYKFLVKNVIKIKMGTVQSQKRYTFNAGYTHKGPKNHTRAEKFLFIIKN